MRTGSRLFPVAPDTMTDLGRAFTCAACGARVDAVEIKLTAHATGQSMRPDLCGPCQSLASTVEPVIEVS